MRAALFNDAQCHLAHHCPHSPRIVSGGQSPLVDPVKAFGPCLTTGERSRLQKTASVRWIETSTEKTRRGRGMEARAEETNE